MSETPAICELCGEPMPLGEQMFKYHGYSGPCPRPPLPTTKPTLEEVIGDLEKIVCQVYDREHFSPLGDALIALHNKLSSLRATQ